MAKQKQLKVSLHESGQFIKWVGKTKGEDGNFRPKCWYLGDDQTAAISKAASLQQEWKALKSQGIVAWPKQVKPVEINPIEIEPVTKTLTIKEGMADMLG